MSIRTSEVIADLAGALAKAQGAFGNPSKDREVQVKTRAGDTYKFKYATFTAVVDAARKPLAENGLSFIQVTSADEHGHLITTRLLHASGQWIEFDTPVFVAAEGAQAFGSGVTYAKRYALSTMLGITADEDDDANTAEGNNVDMRTRAPNAPKPRPAPPPTGAASQGGAFTDPNKQRAFNRDTKDEAAAVFVEQAIETINLSATKDDLTGWWRKNAAALARLESERGPQYEKLLRVYDDKMEAAKARAI